jgi:hypothetical protein
MELAETFLAAVFNVINDEFFSCAVKVLMTLYKQGRRQSIFRGNACLFLENKNDFFVLIF